MTRQWVIIFVLAATLVFVAAKLSTGQTSSTSTFKGKAFLKKIVIECPQTISCDRLFVGVENPNVPEGWNEKTVYNFTGSLEIYGGSVKAGALWCEYKLQGWSWQKPYLRLTRPIPTGYNCTAVHGGKFNCTHR